MSLDKLVSSIVALGVPGLVIVITMSSLGYVGAAAVAGSLAILGGPLGMMGGFALLGLLVLLSKAGAKYGYKIIYQRVLKGLEEKGKNKTEIENKIKKYPISKSLKLELIDYLSNKEGK